MRPRTRPAGGPCRRWWPLPPPHPPPPAPAQTVGYARRCAPAALASYSKVAARPYSVAPGAVTDMQRRMAAAAMLADLAGRQRGAGGGGRAAGAGAEAGSRLQVCSLIQSPLLPVGETKAWMGWVTCVAAATCWQLVPAAGLPAPPAHHGCLGLTLDQPHAVQQRPQRRNPHLLGRRPQRGAQGGAVVAVGSPVKVKEQPAVAVAGHLVQPARQLRSISGGSGDGGGGGAGKWQAGRGWGGGGA